MWQALCNEEKMMNLYKNDKKKPTITCPDKIVVFLWGIRIAKKKKKKKIVKKLKKVNKGKKEKKCSNPRDRKAGGTVGVRLCLTGPNCHSSR